MEFSNKFNFSNISKEFKNDFFNSLKSNNIEYTGKVTPIFKSGFQGTIYFYSFSDLCEAKKLFTQAKEREQVNFQNWLNEKRKQLNFI